jgi:hypothetical protein
MILIYNLNLINSCLICKINYIYLIQYCFNLCIYQLNLDFTMKYCKIIDLSLLNRKNEASFLNFKLQMENSKFSILELLKIISSIHFRTYSLA